MHDKTREEKIVSMMVSTQRLNEWVLKMQLRKIQMQTKPKGRED